MPKRTTPSPRRPAPPFELSRSLTFCFADVINETGAPGVDELWCELANEIRDMSAKDRTQFRRFLKAVEVEMARLPKKAQASLRRISRSEANIQQHIVLAAGGGVILGGGTRRNNR
jgi:hypothetical protein